MADLYRRNVDARSYLSYSLCGDDGVVVDFDGWFLGEAYSLDGYGLVASEWGFLLYRTVGERFVCERYVSSPGFGGPNRHDVTDARSVQEVVKFFGLGQLAKELYSDARICLDGIAE